MSTAAATILRDAEPGDRAFLLALYASTRADEFTQFCWPPDMERGFMQMQYEAQRSDYLRRHPDARCQVIELQRCPIGRLWVAQDARSLTILDISLIEALRGQGIGTACLRHVQQRAVEARLDVELQVLVGSPAHRLYERLGFRNVGDAGVRQAMVWHPLPRAPGTTPATNPQETHHEQA
jgi:GNAT superfamily N-acetyltransferase